jgi:hypothetical protein
MFSLETLNFLAELLANTSIRPNFDDFDEVARKMGNARRELICAISEAESAQPTKAV